MVVKGTATSGESCNEVPDAEIRGVRSRSEVPNVKCAVMRIRRSGVARRARDRLLSGLLVGGGGVSIVAVSWEWGWGWV